MDVMEKLVELLSHATFGVNKQTILSYLPPSAIAEVVGYLIANGVTVQEWISVKDRLPEENGRYLCNVNLLRSLAVSIKLSYNAISTDSERGIFIPMM